MVSVEITAVFAAALAIVQVAFTMRVINFRFANQVSLGDGGHSELQKRVRAHANFTETVPIALILLLLNELSGTADHWLYGLGGALVVARVFHYAGIAFQVPLFFRLIGMLVTILVIVALPIALLV